MKIQDDTDPSSRRTSPDSWGNVVPFLAGAVIPLFVAFNGGGLDSVFRGQATIGLWWALALGVAFGVIPRGGASTRSLPLAAFAALVAWTAASLIWTESAERTFSELNRVLGYGGVIALALLAVDRHGWRAAAAGVAAGLLTLPALALLSRILPGVLVSGPSFASDRLAYPLEYWNALASWAAMAAVLGLVLSSEFEGRATRAVALAAVPIAACTIYLTYSRGGFLVLGVGILTGLLVVRRRGVFVVHAIAAAAAAAAAIMVVRGHPEIAQGIGDAGAALVALALMAAAGGCALLSAWTATRRRKIPRPGPRLTQALALAGAVGIAITGVLVVPGVADTAGEQLTSPGYPAIEEDSSARLTSLEGSRDEIWGSATRAFGSEPLVGRGPGTFDLWYARDVLEGERVRDAHSLYLETLAELGLVGLVVLLAALGSLLYAAIRTLADSRCADDRALRGALVAAYVVFLFHAGIDWIWESTATTTVALLAGSVAAASPTFGRKRSKGARQALARTALTITCVAAGALQVPAVVATERIRASLESLEIGQLGKAQRTVDEAVDAEPWAASPYALRATILLERDRPEQARRDARRALAREPTNWLHAGLLSRSLKESGDDAGAARALTLAERLRTQAP